MKKLVSIVLALALVLAVAVASAQTVGTASTGTGSITISNASRGDTYKLFKLFDATLTNTPTTGDSAGIAYTGDIPSALSTYFTKDEAGNIHVAKHEVEGSQVEYSDSEITTAVQNWAKDLPETDSHYVTKATSDGSELIFQGVPYGYYAVTSTLGATITVDSNRPNATIKDKNTKNPSAYKAADAEEYSVGDTVTYTAVFDAPNYLNNPTTHEPEQIVSYKITDTLPNFLKDVAIDSVIIGKFDKDNDYALIGTAQADLSSSYTAFDSNKTIEIPWVDETVPTSDHKYTSKYTSNTQIKIVYHATLTANANLVSDNQNIVSLFPQVDRGEGKEPYQETDEWNAHDEITTYGAALKKVDEQGNTLPGAEFVVNGLTVTGANGLYTVVSYNPNGTTGTTMQTDANGLLRIGGLKSELTLVVTETKAPDGYNKISGTFNVTTTKLSSETTSSSGSVTRYYDADGNLVDTQAQATSTVTTTEYTSISNIPAASIVSVENHKGTELPSTGGIGTTIFYILGGLLVVGAAVILVARRKASN